MPSIRSAYRGTMCLAIGPLLQTLDGAREPLLDRRLAPADDRGDLAGAQTGREPQGQELALVGGQRREERADAGARLAIEDPRLNVIRRGRLTQGVPGHGPPLTPRVIDRGVPRDAEEPCREGDTALSIPRQRLGHLEEDLLCQVRGLIR